MIACLTIPYFAAAVERRDDTALNETPLVVGGRPWEPRPLFGFSQEVARQGVQPGMSLRLAHTLSPDARFLPAALSRYRAGSGEVVETLTDFTPLLLPEPLWQQAPAGQALAQSRTLPARYTLDLEGLPQREALPLAQEMGRSVRTQTTLTPSVGLAADPFTAQVAAALARPHHLRPVPPEETAPFLAGRPLSFLPLPRETARRLRLLGIRTLGQFAALPSPAVQEQFGPETLPLHRLARGEGERALAPPAPGTEIVVAHAFQEGVSDRLVLARTLAQLATELAEALAARAEAGRRLALTWETEDGTQQRSLPLRQPASTAATLARILEELLAGIDVTTGVTALSVTLGELAPVAGRQLSLFARGGNAAGMDKLPGLLARHPGVRCYRPALADPAHPLAECRFQLQPLSL